MLHKDAAALAAFIASDGCRLAEVIHPVKDGTAPGLSLARASLPPGGVTSPHYLDFLEIYYFLSGRGVMHVGPQSVEVGPDDCVYLEPGNSQWLENSDSENDLVFLCVCHPAWHAKGDHPLKDREA